MVDVSECIVCGAEGEVKCVNIRDREVQMRSGELSERRRLEIRLILNERLRYSMRRSHKNISRERAEAMETTRQLTYTYVIVIKKTLYCNTSASWRDTRLGRPRFCTYHIPHESSGEADADELRHPN